MPALSNLILISLVLALSACAQLPKNDSAISSAAYFDTRETSLGLSVTEKAGSHPGKTGFYALSSGVDALLSRLILAAQAERSLDIQYYIWHKDDTGMLVLGAVLQAAERGVRVRLLLDDINSAAIEPMLVAVAHHPNVEVRLFNPFASRSFRAWDFVTRFSQVNRRMHNKSFTADNQVTIVGGRNLGDEYFSARPDLEFGDLDVMVIGEVVPEVSDAFDLYWNSELAYPIEDLQPAASGEISLREVQTQLREHAEDMRQSPYGDRVRQGKLADELRQDRAHWYWGDAELMYDHPDKALGQDAEATTHLSHSLAPVFKQVGNSMLLVSPYFVPGREGVEFFTALAERGVRVRVVTNSLAATDVTVVHSGYARYRKALLQGGVRLYEFKPNAATADVKRSGSLSGSSQASLHAKTFSLDGRWLFIGSLNLDPRSLEINTEIGILFDLPEAAGTLDKWADQDLSNEAYRLEWISAPEGEGGAGGRIEWVERGGEREIRYRTDPQTSGWRRLSVWLFSLLPIESQL